MTNLLKYCCLSLLALPAALGQVIVYDNTSTSLDYNFSIGTIEVGDQIILAGTDRNPSEFTFAYFGVNLAVTAEARIRFYANDGPLVSGFASPGTVLFDTGFFPAVNTAPFSFIIDDFSAGSGALIPFTGLLPDSFTWSIQFQNIGGGTAGVPLYSTPTIGNNYTDYWDRTGGNWTLKVAPIGGPSHMDFYAQLVAVPEPSAYGLAGGILALIFAARRIVSRKNGLS